MARVNVTRQRALLVHTARETLIDLWCNQLSNFQRYSFWNVKPPVIGAEEHR
jgi:hypothetical protein